jgi:hypothetical protein
MTCARCRKLFESKHPGSARFCGPVCRVAAWRASQKAGPDALQAAVGPEVERGDVGAQPEDDRGPKAAENEPSQEEPNTKIEPEVPVVIPVWDQVPENETWQPLPEVPEPLPQPGGSKVEWSGDPVEPQPAPPFERPAVPWCLHGCAADVGKATSSSCVFCSQTAFLKERARQEKGVVYVEPPLDLDWR